MKFKTISQTGTRHHTISFSSGKMFVDDHNHGPCLAVPVLHGLRVILPNQITWVWRESDDRVEQFPNYVPDSTVELFTCGYESRIDECLAAGGVGAGVMARIEAKTKQVWKSIF